jgi:hypothetical protein
MEMPVMVRAAVPGFDSVVDRVPAEVPTGVAGKVSVLEPNTAWGVGAAVPVPAIVAAWGEPEALSATEIEALRLPVEAGVKVTVMRQALSNARLAGQLLVSEKLLGLAPVMEMPVMLRAALPGLERVIVMVADELPTLVLGKVSGFGFSTA